MSLLRRVSHGLTEEIIVEKAPIELKHILKPREDGTQYVVSWWRCARRYRQEHIGTGRCVTSGRS